MVSVRVACLLAVVSVSSSVAGQQSDSETPSDELFLEPTRIVHQIAGESAGDEFGWVARVVGDVDGDDVLDFVATAPSFKRWFIDFAESGLLAASSRLTWTTPGLRVECASFSEA